MKKMSRRIITNNETLWKINTTNKGPLQGNGMDPISKRLSKITQLNLHDLIRLKLRKLSWVNFRINNFWIKFLYNFFT